MRLLATALVLGVLLAGCGASSEAPADNAAPAETTTPAPTPEDELTTAIHAYSTAYLTGDGVTAHGLLSKRCKESIALSEFAALTEISAEMYGDVEISDLEVKVKGDRATATYTYPVKTLNQTDEVWLLEDGEWKTDGCPAA